MILIAELISHFVNGNVNMAKIMKKAQTGKNVPKGMVESEMFPGKMIPKSKSNYANGEYAKMLDNNRKAILKSAAKKVAKQSANEISKSPAKKPMKAGGMLKRADGSYSKRGYGITSELTEDLERSLQLLC